MAVAKTASDYDPERGLKWSLPKLFRFFRAMHGHSKVTKTMQDLAKVIIESLRSVQNLIIQDSHCFELYGYDILFDENLKPWLLEVRRVLSRPIDHLNVLGQLALMGGKREKIGFEDCKSSKHQNNNCRLTQAPLSLLHHRKILN